MPVNIDPTVGGANANSYVDVATANAYFDGHQFGATWRALEVSDQDQQARLLITATRILNRRRYRGALSSNTQKLEWPRAYVPMPYDPDVQLPPGTLPLLLGYYDPTTIPTPVIEATCELALELLGAGADNPFGADDTINVRSDKTGPLETTYADLNNRVFDIERYPEVMSRIAPLLIASRQTRVVRS